MKLLSKIAWMEFIPFNQGSDGLASEWVTRNHEWVKGWEYRRVWEWESGGSEKSSDLLSSTWDLLARLLAHLNLSTYTCAVFHIHIHTYISKYIYSPVSLYPTEKHSSTSCGHWLLIRNSLATILVFFFTFHQYGLQKSLSFNQLMN